MNDLAQKLIEELQCETVFTIPVLGGIPVSEAVVVTWIIMAVLVIAAFILTRNLKVDHISKRQAVAESIVTGLMNMVQGMVGEKRQEICALSHNSYVVYWRFQYHRTVWL